MVHTTGAPLDTNVGPYLGLETSVAIERSQRQCKRDQPRSWRASLSWWLAKAHTMCIYCGECRRYASRRLLRPFAFRPQSRQTTVGRGVCQRCLGSASARKLLAYHSYCVCCSFNHRSARILTPLSSAHYPPPPLSSADPARHPPYEVDDLCPLPTDPFHHLRQQPLKLIPFLPNG